MGINVRPQYSPHILFPRCRRLLSIFVLLALCPSFVGQSQKASLNLQITKPDPNGWIRLVSAGSEERVHMIEASSNLAAWTNVAILHNGPFNFADPASAQTALAEVRDLIRTKARFSPADQAAILSALAAFNPNEKIRFRSSTNVEDSEQFTGAGLYDSFSGCLADDLDGDTDGPSHCDPDEQNERGVFRAIRRVYAGFYNDNAWLERLRFSLAEDKVGMAVLVHHSFPDEDELANGVATLKYSQSGNFKTYQGDLVTQVGAVSVSNPEGGSTPEVVNAYKSSGGTFLNVLDHSNLLPLGATVMNWESNYQKLLDLLARVTDGYAQLFPGRNNFLLDFEYKKIRPGELIVKQVRELPTANSVGTVVPFLLNVPFRYCIAQGEQGDVFANHRLKAQLTLGTRNTRLESGTLYQTIYTNGTIELLDGTNRLILTKGPPAWPNAIYSVEGNVLRDRWSIGAGQQKRDFTLETTSIPQVHAAFSPILTQSDLRKTLGVTYASPVPRLSFEGNRDLVTNEFVLLTPCPAVTPQSLKQNRVITTPAGVTVETSFYWPEPPTGVVAGYTAPLVEWVETRISGLTTEPIVLHGYYSQTYRPGHHNFSEEFIFEPQLESGLSQPQVDQLAARKIKLLHLLRGDGLDRITALDFEGNFRPLP